MFASFGTALVLLFSIALLVYGWIKVSIHFHFHLEGLHLRGFKRLKVYWRSLGSRIDFEAPYCSEAGHFSIDDPSFCGKYLGSLLWGAKLAFCAEGYSLRFSPTRMKVQIRLEKLSIFLSILPEMFLPLNSRSQGKLHTNIFRILQIFVSIEVDEIRFVTTSLPKSPNQFQSIVFLEAAVRKVLAFKEVDHLSLEPRPPFTLEAGNIVMKEYSVSDFTEFTDSKIDISTISATSIYMALTDDSIRFDISSGPLIVDVHVSMLFFIWSIAQMADTSAGNGKQTNSLSLRLLFNLQITSITINAHLPSLDDSLQPIKKVRLSLAGCFFDFIVREGNLNYIGSATKLTFGAFFARIPDPKCFTKCDQILNRLPSSDVENVLISIEDFLFGNCEKLESCVRQGLISGKSINSLFDSLLSGKVNWDFFKNLENANTEDVFSYQDLMVMTNRLSFMLYSDFKQNLTMLLVSKLTFSVPFEFPLSSLVEDLALLVKSPIMMHKPQVTPQSFNVFNSKWEITLSCPDVSWTFGDDPLEARLSNIFKVKQKIVSRFTRLEKMFRKRLKKETDEMKTNESDKISDNLINLARSSSFADLLGESCPMVNKYTRFNEHLFSLYRKEFNHFQEDDYPGLMDVKISEFTIRLKWSPEYLGKFGIHDLLNAMENSSSGYSRSQTELFSVFLGSYLEFSGRGLNVFLRDYDSEFISFDRFEICGPILLLEEGAYDEACVGVPVRTGIQTALSNICPDIVTVLETVLPIKVFHSLGTRLSGEYGFKAAFSPFWDGVFVGLDRAFDMLSKQSRERSPRLAIWDKFRLFVHSSYGFMYSDCPCYFSFYPGKSGMKYESLVIKLSKGFELEMKPDRFIFEFGEFEGLVGSHSLALLRYLLQKNVETLDAILATSDSIPLMKLIHFAKTTFAFRAEGKNAKGETPVEHQKIIMAAATSGVEHEACDSFRDFRIASLITSLEVATDDASKSTYLYLYDELINWVKKNLLGFTETSVRKGPLFESPFVIVNAEGKDSVLSIVDEIHFKFHFDGVFSCIYLNFFDEESFGGLHLTSTETSIALDYAKSKPADESSGITAKWTYYFGSIDFQNINLDVISSDHRVSDWVERFREKNQLRLLPTTIRSMSLISSPRLFYTCIDDLCFQHDPKARSAQLKSTKKHRAEWTQKIEALEKNVLESTSEDQVKKLAILKEHYNVISETSNSANVEKHFYFIHDAKLFWHKGLRDSVYHFVDQQFVRHFIRDSKSRSAFESISRMRFENPKSPTQSPSPKGDNPSGKKFRDSAAAEDAKVFYEKLLKRSSIMLASKEEVDLEEDSSVNIDLRSPIELVAEAKADASIALEKFSNVYFYTVQLVLSDEDHKTSALTAPYCSVEVGSLIDTLRYEDGASSNHIGSRTKVNLENMCIFLSNEENWSSSPVFDKITEPTSAIVIFNNKDTHYHGQLDLSPIGLDKGNTLTVFSPELNLFMSSPQYSQVSQLISNLLVYRDPGQRVRAEQLEALVLASDLLDKSTVLDVVESLQHRVHRLENSLINSIYADRMADEKFKERLDMLTVLSEELGLIVEGMATIRTAKEKWGKSQTRLQMDIIVDSIELTMLRIDHSPMTALSMRSIHDTWISDTDFSMSNLIEIGEILAFSRTPGSFYKTLIQPLPKSLFQAAGIGLGYSDQALRIYWKTLLPIGGIPIIEHAELNLSPLSIQLSYEIAAEATKFFFPEKVVVTKNLHSEEFDIVDSDELLGTQKLTSTLTRESSFQAGKSSLSRMESMEEILSMQQKASDHCSFVSIQVPASQHIISYKGKPGTTITDIENFMLKLPTFEYHNRIWSWSELFLRIRKGPHHNHRFAANLLVDAIRVAYLNAGSLLKEKIRRLGQSNLSEEQRLNRTPSLKAADQPKPVSTDVNLDKSRKMSFLYGKSFTEK